MPQMNPDLLQMMAELADDSDIMGQISQSVPSRSRGAGARVSIGGSGGSGYSVPQLAREYVGQAEASAEATDDGQNGPVAAKSHAMAYMEDPQWKHWDQMRTGAVNSMKGGGGFWGWATGGRYNAAVGQEAQYADYMARQIEKRYLDEATVRAANTDRYDWTKPSRQAVYNPETGTYADEFTGTLGGKAMRPVDRPTQDMVTETGAVVSATRGPANQGWVTKGAITPPSDDPELQTKYINGSTEPPTEGPFAGGVVAVEQSMPVIRDAKMLSENAKARSEVKRDEAAAKKDEALAAAAGAEEFSSAAPGSVVYDKRSGKQKFSVPQTASQSGANRSGGNKPMATKDIVAQARANALASVPKPKLNEWDPKAGEKMAEWEARFNTKFESELERIEGMASGGASESERPTDNSPAPKASPKPAHVGNTGKRKRVDFDANGNLVDVE